MATWNPAKFENELKAGDLVEARFTNCSRYYAYPAKVVTVNRASIRVAFTVEQRGWPIGHETTIPRWTANTYSNNNCLAPTEGSSAWISE